MKELGGWERVRLRFVGGMLRVVRVGVRAS